MSHRDNLNYSCFNINQKIVEKLGRQDLLQNGNFDHGDIAVYFRNIKSHLCRHIERAELVLGCVAWLTDFDILTSLAQTKSAIIVQKEDFLRPDTNDIGKAKLQAMYGKIRSNLKRSDFLATVLYPKIQDDDADIGGVRCIGNYNREQRAAHPRMHNKFLVFCERNDCMALTTYCRWRYGQAHITLQTMLIVR